MFFILDCHRVLFTTKKKGKGFFTLFTHFNNPSVAFAMVCLQTKSINTFFENNVASKFTDFVIFCANLRLYFG